MNNTTKLQQYAKILNAGFTSKSKTQKLKAACLLLHKAIELDVDINSANTGLQDNTTGAGTDNIVNICQRMIYAV